MARFALNLLAAAMLGVLIVPVRVLAQRPPATDVYLGSLNVHASSSPVTDLRNVTARAGYDNQPAFSRDGASLYFTSIRDDAQADIYRYHLASGRTSRITVTAPESEYSAAEIPATRAIAVIRVERDSTQRLWRLPLRGGRESALFPSLKPVGYHAWADNRFVAMFVLGAPPALVVGDLVRGTLDTVVLNIGRSLHRVPGTTRLSFVSKAYEEVGWVMELDPVTRAMRPLARLPKDTEDFAWLPDGRLIAGSASRLVVCNLAQGAHWETFADLSDSGITGITRLAISAGGDRIAVVAIAAPTP